MECLQMTTSSKWQAFSSTSRGAGYQLWSDIRWGGWARLFCAVGDEIFVAVLVKSEDLLDYCAWPF